MHFYCYLLMIFLRKAYEYTFIQLRYIKPIAWHVDFFCDALLFSTELLALKTYKAVNYTVLVTFHTNATRHES